MIIYLSKCFSNSFVHIEMSISFLFEITTIPQKSLWFHYKQAINNFSQTKLAYFFLILNTNFPPPTLNLFSHTGLIPFKKKNNSQCNGSYEGGFICWNIFQNVFQSLKSIIFFKEFSYSFASMIWFSLIKAIQRVNLFGKISYLFIIYKCFIIK